MAVEAGERGRSGDGRGVTAGQEGVAVMCLGRAEESEGIWRTGREAK